MSYRPQARTYQGAPLRSTIAMRRLLLTTLCCAPLSAQELNILEGFRPFRAPSEVVEVPREVFDDLQVMLNALQSPGSHAPFIDDQGREVSDHPAWRAAHDRLADDIHLYAGRFGLVLRDSKLVNDRRLAAYGTFLLDDPKQVFELIAFFPGEPERDIRQDAMRRAIHYLRVHHPKDVESSEGIAPMYQLNVGPYLALLELDEPRDQAQGLWFLKEVMTIRPDSNLTILEYAKKQLPGFLVAEHPDVRQQAYELVEVADPAQRTAPPPDAEDAALSAWLDQILYETFPPIRQISEGLIDLYPSEDLDRILDVGRDVLRNSSIGGPHSGVLASGMHYRGFRVLRVPEPLELLRIPLEAVVTSINGQPVTSGPEVLAAIEGWLPARKRLFVEYVVAGQSRVMEYRLR